MGKIRLNNNSVENSNCLILIFVEGTILKPNSWINFFNIDKYIPTVGSVDKIKEWASQGAEIVYLTSRKNDTSIRQIKNILAQYKFEGVFLYYRANREKYKDIVAQIHPRILIEDDCKSIGGIWQMCITHTEKSLKSKIISIVVKEFGGLNYLSGNLDELMQCQKSNKL